LKIKLVVGDNDEYIDDKRLNEHESLLKNYQLDYELIRFKGRHEIPESEFKEMFS